MTGSDHLAFTDEAAASSRAVRPADLRRHNLALVLRHVSASEGLTRAELARLTALTKGTISSLAEELIERGFLVESAPEPQGRLGRPPTGLLALNGDSHCGIGIEINIDYLAVSVADLRGRIRFHMAEGRDNRIGRRTKVLDRAARAVRDAARIASSAGLQPAGVSLAVPGPVDVERGILMRAPGLAWTDVPVVDELADRLADLGLPVLAENEANLAALGELWLGIGSTAGDYVYVSGESGVGGGIIVDGALVRGSRGSAGEIGHIVVDPNGPPCTCGGRGCLGQMAGQETLFRLAGLEPDQATRQVAGEPALDELLAMLGRGDLQALEAVDKVAHALGIALADIVNLLDPDSIILGGIYAPLSPWLIGPIVESLGRQDILGGRNPVAIHSSLLGADAAVRGAATLVVKQLMSGSVAETQGAVQPHLAGGQM
jgi:predicted NBD/HSP70 family sugar kinase